MNQNPTQSEPESAEQPSGEGLSSSVLFAEPVPLLAELVFYGAHNYGNYALCGKCGATCGRDGCYSCDESGEVDGEPCEDCLDGERFWCDHCGEIEGWLPNGQSAPRKSSANEKTVPTEGGEK